jgi:spermidine synthase
MGAWIAARAGAPRLAAAGAVAGVALVAASLLGAPGLRHPVRARIDSHPHVALLDHREDRVAAVTAFRLDAPRRARPQYHLLVNGIGMTALTVDTKLLAHLPGALHPDARRALVLCFGMGTAFRSSLAYPYERVDAVELVPSVPRMMQHYHEDAEAALSDPRGRVILDDARHYLASTRERYDIISSDPPPPLRSAGTVLLLSQEFYEAGRRRLEPGGLFVQWLPFGDGTLSDYATLVRTFRSVFPVVSAWRSLHDYGFFLVGSEREVRFDAERAAARLGDPRVWRDLVEWNGARFESPLAAAQALAALRLATPAALDAALGPGPVVTDDHPRSEYHLLRTRLGWDRSPEGRARAVLEWIGGGAPAPGGPYNAAVGRAAP